MGTTLPRWRRSRRAEAIASGHASAPCYRSPENVRVLAVVMPKLKLREVEREVAAGDIVVRADDAALEQRPEGIEVRRVDDAAHVLVLVVVHRLVWEAHAPQAVISAVLVRRDERDLGVNDLLDEAGHLLRRHALQHLTGHVALAADRTDDRHLVVARDRALAGPFHHAPTATVTVTVLAADVRLVDFDDAHEPLEVGVLHRGPQPVTHVPRGLVGACADLPLNLHGADALLAVEHLPQHLEPGLERVLRVLEHRAADDGEAVGVPRPARPVRALPAPGHRLEGIDLLGLATARAGHRLRPPTFEEVLLAVVLAGEGRHQLPKRHHKGERSTGRAIRQVPDTPRQGESAAPGRDSMSRIAV